MRPIAAPDPRVGPEIPRVGRPASPSGSSEVAEWVVQVAEWVVRGRRVGPKGVALLRSSVIARVDLVTVGIVRGQHRGGLLVVESASSRCSVPT